jgi:molecular chaperone Hsp33
MNENQEECDDVLVRAMALNKTVRLVIARTRDTCDALRRAHDAGPLGATALGRVATAAVLLSATLKDRQQVGVQVNGDGPLGELYAIADWTGRVRATVARPLAMTEDGTSVDLSAGVGEGSLSIIKGLSEDAPYRGVVPLVTGGIAEDLAHYLLSSEQVNSAVAIGERLGAEGVLAAGGLFIQAMPGADDSAMADLVQRLESLPPIAECFAQSMTAEMILERLCDDAEIVAQTPISYHCPCTREEFARRLCMLGEEELKDLTKELETVDAECHFCRTTYSFDQEQMNALIYGARMYDLAD